MLIKETNVIHQKEENFFICSQNRLKSDLACSRMKQDKVQL